MTKISDYFRRVSENRRRNRITKARCKTLHSAIQSLDLAAVQALADGTVTFDHSQTMRLLYAAVNSDNVPVFNAVLADCVKGDINYKIHERITGAEYSYESQFSLLHLAIANNRPAIALAIANDPSADTQFSGYSCSGRKPKEPYDTPLAMAVKDKTMPDVVTALSKRSEMAADNNALLAKEVAELKERLKHLENPRPVILDKKPSRQDKV